MNRPTAADVLDRQILEMRARVLALAADLDRIDRATGHVGGDERLAKLRDAAERCFDGRPDRAAAVQMIFSDTTPAPVQQQREAA
jgi:hypothetical protein